MRARDGASRGRTPGRAEMRVPVNLVQFCYIQYIVSSGTPRQLIVPCVDMPSRAPSLPLAVRQRSQRAFADTVPKVCGKPTLWPSVWSLVCASTKSAGRRAHALHDEAADCRTRSSTPGPHSQHHGMARNRARDEGEAGLRGVRLRRRNRQGRRLASRGEELRAARRHSWYHLDQEIGIYLERLAAKPTGTSTSP